MNRILEVDLTDTLMAWTGEFHVQSGDRHSTYYLSVPDAWVTLAPATLKSNVMAVFGGIYDDFDRHFKAVEPDDLGYLAPLNVAPRLLTSDEEKAAPWLTAGSPAAWEWTPCVVVSDDGTNITYHKVEPSNFK